MAKNNVVRRITAMLGGAALLAGGFYAGTAFASNARLDQAKENVVKAQALLKAAENPEAKPPFGGHRAKALRHLKRAVAAIDEANKWAENPPKWAVKNAKRAKKREEKKKSAPPTKKSKTPVEKKN